MTERRTSDGRRESLEKKMTDLTVGVVGMKGAMEGLAKALQSEVDDLKAQNEKQRRLSKYNRRTHFMVLSWIVILGLLASDLGRRYCGADGEVVTSDFVGAACNVAFWTTEHGGGTGWRVVGLIVHISVLIFFWAHSQVPADLYSEVAASQVKRERAQRREERTNKRRQRDRRFWRIS